MFASLNNLLVPSLPFSFPYHLNQFIPFTFSKSKVRDAPCAISLAGTKWQLHLFDYTVIGASEIGREKEREMESSCLPVAYLVFFGRSHPFLWNEVRPNSGCHFCVFTLIHFSVGQRGETPQASLCGWWTAMLHTVLQRSMPNASDQFAFTTGVPPSPPPSILTSLPVAAGQNRVCCAFHSYSNKQCAENGRENSAVNQSDENGWMNELEE